MITGLRPGQRAIPDFASALGLAPGTVVVVDNAGAHKPERIRPERRWTPPLLWPWRR
jgi:hypothetical protein